MLKMKGDDLALICKKCDGLGYIEYPDYDFDDELSNLGIKTECTNCNGTGYEPGYSPIDTLERLAGVLTKYDIDEDICKKVNCKLCECDYDNYDCVKCIIEFFSRPCRWEQDDVCVNDKSEWCADFVDNTKCGRCKYFQRSFTEETKEISKDNNFTYSCPKCGSALEWTYDIKENYKAGEDPRKYGVICSQCGYEDWD